MHRMLVWFVLAGLGLAHAACGSPVAPSSPQPTAVQLSGYVDDTAFRAVSNAIVEVLDGPQAGSSTITDVSGRFSLTGQFKEATRFRATKDGYQAAIQTFQSTPMIFFLGIGGPSGNSATLTLEADPACTELPSEVRRRTYAATITAPSSTLSTLPVNTIFTAILTGASLDSYFHVVYIHVAGDFVTFDLSDNGIEEEVAPEVYLYVGGYGGALAQAGAPAISAPLSGTIDYCVLKSDPGAAYPCSDQAVARVQCRSANNRLTLTWR
jgi:hypothetical protein